MESRKRRGSKEDRGSIDDRWKKRAVDRQEEEEENRLASVLFGTGDEALPPPEPAAPTDPFQIDRRGERGPVDADDSVARKEIVVAAASEAVWIDEDEPGAISLRNAQGTRGALRRHAKERRVGALEYASRLRERRAGAEWARVPLVEEEADALSSAARLVRTGRLPGGVLKVARCHDANQAAESASTVTAVGFGAVGGERPVCFTAGLDGTVRLFRVDGEENVKLGGVHFPNLPIRCAAWVGDSGTILASGRRKYFYLYETETGAVQKIPHTLSRSNDKSRERFAISPDGTIVAFCASDGYVVLLEVSTRLTLGSLKINGHVNALSFDGDFLWATGSHGDLHKFHLGERRLVERFAHQDGSVARSLASSPQMLAVGTDSGVVELYSPDNNNHLKSVLNLSTSVQTLRFSRDSQILAMSSSHSKESLKLLHVPTRTVFSNWPTSKTPLGYVHSMDFSPCGRYFAIGNNKGKCLLYNISHYNNHKSTTII